MKDTFIDTIKKWITKTAEQPYFSLLRKELKSCKTVLDVGYGTNSPLTKLDRKFLLEGIDIIHPPKKSLRHHNSYKIGDIRKLRSYYKKNSFDGVVALDVIEHLSRKSGTKLLQDMDWIAKKKIIILTPNGFLYQKATKDNPYMKHLSGWYVKDFLKNGYHCYGLHGIKFLRGSEAKPKWSPWYMWLFLSHLTQIVAYFFPAAAFHLFAVKTKNSTNV